MIGEEACYDPVIAPKPKSFYRLSPRSMNNDKEPFHIKLGLKVLKHPNFP